ncbi:RicinB_lectin_2 domain-containing protein, partial [Cephalotus follicularis]
MESPFGHHHHHQHHQRHDDSDQEDERPPPHYPPPPDFNDHPPPPFNHPPPPPFNHQPPPPYYQQNEFEPPPPYAQQPEYPSPPRQVTHHTTEYQPNLDYPPPPTHVSHEYHQVEQQTETHQSYRPPPPTQVSHVSHQVEQEPVEQQTETHHSHRPHLPSFLHHSTPAALDLSKKPTYKVFCKAAPNFHLTIMDGKVVLAPSDPLDEHQNWYKDEKFSTRVKDEEGYPCFALVNKASGQAIKHSIGASHPVQLIPYNPDVLDEAVLWSESKVLDDGYRAVRMINNIRLNLDAFHGDKKSGGVRFGTTVVLWQWNKGDNQRWKITPHCKFL